MLFDFTGFYLASPSSAGFSPMFTGFLPSFFLPGFTAHVARLHAEKPAVRPEAQPSTHPFGRGSSFWPVCGTSRTGWAWRGTGWPGRRRRAPAAFAPSAPPPWPAVWSWPPCRCPINNTERTKEKPTRYNWPHLSSVIASCHPVADERNLVKKLDDSIKRGKN